MWLNASEGEARGFLQSAFTVTQEEARREFRLAHTPLSLGLTERLHTLTTPDIPWECARALQVYCQQWPNVCKRFNEECRRVSSSSDQHDQHDFAYMNLWWMLLEALLRLPAPYKQTATLYRGVRRVKMSDFENESTLLFGQFLSASEWKKAATKFTLEDGIVLELRNVPSLVFRNLESHSPYPQHEEVLLMPFCTFKVVGMTPDAAWGRPVVELEYDGCLLWEPDIIRQLRQRFPGRL